MTALLAILKRAIDQKANPCRYFSYEPDVKATRIKEAVKAYKVEQSQPALLEEEEEAGGEDYASPKQTEWNEW